MVDVQSVSAKVSRKPTIKVNTPTRSPGSKKKSQENAFHNYKMVKTITDSPTPNKRHTEGPRRNKNLDEQMNTYSTNAESGIANIAHKNHLRPNGIPTNYDDRLRRMSINQILASNFKTARDKPVKINKEVLKQGKKKLAWKLIQRRNDKNFRSWSNDESSKPKKYGNFMTLKTEIMGS